MVQRLVNAIMRREDDEPEIPNCPEHGIDMRLRGKQGRPTRFADQSEEEYTYIYFCPVEQCNHTAAVTRVKTQIPAPGEAPERPTFARRD